MLDKGAVEGARGVKAYLLADIGDGIIGVEKITAGLRDAQGVDVIVKAQSQLSAKKMRDIVLVQMQPLLKERERKIFGKILGAEGDDGAQSVGIPQMKP